LKPYCENQKDAEELRDYVTPRNFIDCPEPLHDYYELFLHAGDYEQLQQYCFMEDCKEKRREHLRALWILQRFNLFGGEEWSRLTPEFSTLLQIVRAES